MESKPGTASVPGLPLIAHPKTNKGNVVKTKKAKSCKSHVARSVKSRNLMSSVKAQQLKRQQTQGKLIELDLSQIKPRIKGDLRIPKLSHVINTAKSICKNGLLHPIVVDNSNHMIAGKTRYLALRYISTPRRKRVALLEDNIASGKCKNDLKSLSFDDKDITYKRNTKFYFSVRDFASKEELDRERRAEIAENDCRHDYDQDAIIKRYNELLEEGYVDEPHVHMKGVKSAQQQLMEEFHCCQRTVQRYLNKIDKKNGKNSNDRKTMATHKKPSPKQVASNLKREFTHLEKIASQDAVLETLGKKGTLKFWRSISKLARAKVLELKVEESD